MQKIHWLLTPIVALLLTQVCLAENYPQFRGADSNAVSPTPLPVTWSDVDGNLTMCKMASPLGLAAVEDKLYIGSQNWIRVIQGDVHVYELKSINNVTFNPLSDHLNLILY